MPITAPNTLRVVRTDGTQVLSLAVNAATFLLTKLDLGFPEPRDVADVLAGQDGEVDTTAYVGARAITAEVVISQVGAGPLIDQLTAVMHPGLRHWLYVGRSDWPSERRILGRGASFTCPPGSPRTAQLGFHCAAGLLEDTVSETITLSPQGGSLGGSTFPETFPMSFDPGLVPGAALLTVGGTAPTAPIIDIYGPCNNPLFRVVTTGAEIRIFGDIAAGDFVRIDVAARTILLNNDPNASLYGQLDFATATWPTLPVGNLQVVYSPASSSSPSQAVLTWVKKWL